MINKAPCVMFLTRADTLRGEVGGDWALEMESLLGPVKWHGADRRMPFGAQKTLDFQGPTTGPRVGCRVGFESGTAVQQPSALTTKLRCTLDFWHWSHPVLKRGNFFRIFSFFHVRYSTLFHLPPLRFHRVRGCWDRTQDCCDFGIDSARRSNQSAISHLPPIYPYMWRDGSCMIWFCWFDGWDFE